MRRFHLDQALVVLCLVATWSGCKYEHRALADGAAYIDGSQPALDGGPPPDLVTTPPPDGRSDGAQPSVEIDAGSLVVPTVVRSVPPEGATGVSVNEHIVLMFSEELQPPQPAGVQVVEVVDAAGRRLAGQVSVIGAVVTFKPDSSMPFNALQTVSVAGLRGKSGRDIGPHVLRFTTRDVRPEPHSSLSSGIGNLPMGYDPKFRVALDKGGGALLTWQFGENDPTTETDRFQVFAREYDPQDRSWTSTVALIDKPAEKHAGAYGAIPAYVDGAPVVVFNTYGPWQAKVDATAARMGSGRPRQWSPTVALSSPITRIGRLVGGYLVVVSDVGMVMGLKRYSGGVWADPGISDLQGMLLQVNDSGNGVMATLESGEKTKIKLRLLEKHVVRETAGINTASTPNSLYAGQSESGTPMAIWRSGAALWCSVFHEGQWTGPILTKSLPGGAQNVTAAPTAAKTLLVSTPIDRGFWLGEISDCAEGRSVTISSQSHPALVADAVGNGFVTWRSDGKIRWMRFTPQGGWAEGSESWAPPDGAMLFAGPDAVVDARGRVAAYWTEKRPLGGTMTSDSLKYMPLQ